MVRTSWIFCSLLCVACISGCFSGPPKFSRLNQAPAASSHDVLPEPLSRLKTQTASMKLEVLNPFKSASKVETLTVSAGGYVESSTADERDSVNLELRVPQQECDHLLTELGNLGKIKHKQVASEDVTEKVVDVQARLENLRASRDRLRLQLNQTNNVEEVLAVERELTRVQSELESLEARLKVMQDEIAYSKVSLSLERKVIYGPVGYVGKAIWWGFEKLFVLD